MARDATSEALKMHSQSYQTGYLGPAGFPGFSLNMSSGQMMLFNVLRTLVSDKGFIM